MQRVYLGWRNAKRLGGQLAQGLDGVRGELTVCIGFSRCIGGTANFNGELRQGELEL